ncbi:hypothetical protein [Streptomyces canus]|uniref:hypothetical protein n=1 Tax=Streptomyces canus TaxID=58343 RepID=UPI0022510104|nr:hypothetical protein [Streptomyces canus]MCX4858369.1 hypothetical protein [Streptomyces canus]
MSIRGRVAAAALVCAAVVAGVILLWPTPDAEPAAPTSDQIKASAQARLDASLSAGRTVRQQIEASGRTPDDATCQTAWDNQTATERRSLRYAMWMHGCADAPNQ